MTLYKLDKDGKPIVDKNAQESKRQEGEEILSGFTIPTGGLVWKDGKTHLSLKSINMLLALRYPCKACGGTGMNEHQTSGVECLSCKGSGLSDIPVVVIVNPDQSLPKPKGW